MRTIYYVSFYSSMIGIAYGISIDQVNITAQYVFNIIMALIAIISTVNVLQIASFATITSSELSKNARLKQWAIIIAEKYNDGSLATKHIPFTKLPVGKPLIRYVAYNILLPLWYIVIASMLVYSEYSLAWISVLAGVSMIGARLMLYYSDIYLVTANLKKVHTS